MKKKLLTLLFAMVAIVASADFVQGDFTYNVQADGTATIFGFKSGYTGSPTSITIPGYVLDPSTQKFYRVKTIGPYAFNGRTSIQRITVQYGVETISTYAFNGCTSLNTVDLPSSIKSISNGVFYNAPITMINCAAEVMPTLDNNTFSHLGTVSGSRYWTCATPDGMTAANAVSLITSNFTTQWSISAADFHNHVIGTSSEGTLCDVYLNVIQGWDPVTQTYGTVKLLGATPRSSNTSKTLKFGYNQSFSQGAAYYYVTAIGKTFRYRATDLKVLNTSETSKLEEIEANALYGCTALTTLITNAKNIGNYAFYNCTSLSWLTLGTGVESLGALSFAYTAVSDVTIPTTLTTYGNGAFAFCSNLTKFNVSGYVTNFSGVSSAPNCLFNSNKTILYQMGGGTIPSVMQNLSSSLPNELTTINHYAMAGTRLTTVDIPYGVKTLGAYVFSGMPYVATVRIPSSVTSIQSNTFSGMNSATFKNLHINLKTLPSGLQSSSALTNLAGGVTLHVPLWRTNYYKSGSWWSGGWSSKISSVVEDAYDFAYTKTASGNNVDYELRYTVSSVGSYTDTYVQSSAAAGQLTVVGATIGSSSYFNGTITFRDTETHRGKTYITTEVQREVFRDQTLIKRVTGGKGIKKIGALSFAGLTGCTNGFNIPNPIEFCDSSLFNCWTPTITLGNRLTTIGKDAFRSTAVKQVIMPNTVTKIGSRFLAGATQLDSLRLSPNITEIPATGLAWVNCRYIIIPFGVKKIGANAFMSDEYGNGLSEPVHENIVVIPSSVTTIASNAFQYARHLDAIFLNVPYGIFQSTREDWCRRVNTNASNAYDWDYHLLYVPYEHLSGYRGDSGIKAVFVEDDWVRAGAFDFYRGSDLWTTPYRMTVVNPTTKTAKYVHNGYAKVESGSSTGFRTTEKDIFAKDNITEYQGVEYTMTEIGDGCMDATTHYAFVGVDGNNIEDHQGENFSKIILPSTITRIGDYAFRGCSKVSTEVNVPESVSYIGQYAFYGCTQLPSIFLNRTGTTTIGNLCWNSAMNGGNDKVTLYVPLKQMNNIIQQVKTWVPNQYTYRRVLPYLKPTTEWSTISVPVSDAILLPETGDFYYVPSFNSSNNTISKTQLNNEQGIKGGEGMLFKGTVGTVYRFRSATSGVNTPAYISPSNNHLLGVPADYNYVSYNGTSSYWYYTFDGTKFNKATSAISVYSGDACLRLGTAYGATSSTTPVYIDENDMVTYDLWINGTQVNEFNCNDLTVIDGVSGTVRYIPSTKTLTLTNATITSTTQNNLINNIDQLTIRVNGTNNLKAQNTGGGKESMILNAKTYIVGTNGSGSLNCSSYNNLQDACKVNDATLSIQSGAHVSFTGFYGIRGNGYQKAILNMSGTETVLHAGGSYPIGGVKPVLSNGLTVTEPVGAYFDENNNYIMKGSDGYMLHDVTVVISKPTYLRGDINGDGKVDVGDVNIVINIILGKADASSYPGNANVDGVSGVDVSDVNMIINIILGKV